MMTIDFGTGPTLRQACSWLRDDNERWRRILDVVERNSVIEGLPPFQPEMRQRLMALLQALSASSSKPDE
jgi:hypothetical protein